LQRAIAAIEASAHDVRKLAKKRRRWSPEADATARTWLLTPQGVLRAKPFQRPAENRPAPPAG
jgi:hypothetical protein